VVSFEFFCWFVVAAYFLQLDGFLVASALSCFIDFLLLLQASSF
jgi:hypothetical protein